MFGRLRRRCHDAHAVRRLELMPNILRHYSQHARGERQGLPALGRHQVQRRRPIHDMHDLVALRMPLVGVVRSTMRRPTGTMKGLAQPPQSGLVLPP